MEENPADAPEKKQSELESNEFSTACDNPGNLTTSKCTYTTEHLPEEGTRQHSNCGIHPHEHQAKNYIFQDSSPFVESEENFITLNQKLNLNSINREEKQLELESNEFSMACNNPGNLTTSKCTYTTEHLPKEGTRQHSNCGMHPPEYQAKKYIFQDSALFVESKENFITLDQKLNSNSINQDYFECKTNLHSQLSEKFLGGQKYSTRECRPHLQNKSHSLNQNSAHFLEETWSTSSDQNYLNIIRYYPCGRQYLPLEANTDLSSAKFCFSQTSSEVLEAKEFQEDRNIHWGPSVNADFLNYRSNSPFIYSGIFGETQKNYTDFTSDDVNYCSFNNTPDVYLQVATGHYQRHLKSKPKMFTKDQMEIKDIIMNKPDQVCRKFVEAELAELEEVCLCNPKDLKHQFMKYDKLLLGKKHLTTRMLREKRFWNRKLNMYVFGVHKFDSGQFHVNYLKKYCSDSLGNNTTHNRESLLSSYSYIFGSDRHVGVNYFKILCRLIQLHDRGKFRQAL